MATNVETLILKIESRNFDAAQKELDKIRKSAEGAGKAAEGLNTQVGKAPPVFKKFRGATSALTNTTGQLSVQLQDVAVQAQMGTDAVRIFAQQGPQIASIFGPSGAVVGALIAVGAIIAGPFIKSFMQANEEIEKTSKKLDQVKDKIYELSEAERDARMASLAVQMRETQSAISATQETLEEAIATNEKFQNGAKDVETIYFQLKEGVITYEEALNASSKEVLDARATLERLRNEMNEHLTLSGELTGKIKGQTEEQRRNAESVEASLQKGREQLQVLRMSAIEAELFRLQMKGASDEQIEARRVQLEATAAFKEDQKAKKEAEQEAEAQQATRDRFIASIKEQKETFDQSRAALIRYRASLLDLTPAQMAEVEALAQMIEKKEADIAATKKQTEENQAKAKADAKAEKEREALRTAQAALNDAFEQDRQKAVRELKQAGLLEEERMQDMSYQRQLQKLDLFLAQKRISEEEYEKAKKKLDDNVKEYTLNTAADGLKAMGQYNKRAFEASKALETGRAVMQTYSGATKALAELPFPYNIVAAAGIVAFGLAQVAQIQSQTFQGRALGGQVRAGESYVVGERGPELLTMGANGRITPNDKLGGQQQVINRNTNVTFEISTVDAAGFSELLNSRKGQIISMINSAANDRGRRAIA